MKIFYQVIFILWLVFFAYWLVSATSAKRSIQNVSWWKGVIFRFILIALTLLLLRTSQVNHLLVSVESFETGSTKIVLGIIGVFFCVSGMAVAVLARVYIGRNWGMPMSLREDPELVTTGPYAFVRHPIYTGILLAVLGTLLVVGIIWFPLFVIFCAYFVYSAKTEEKYMLKQFPKVYPEYKKRVKAFIP